MYQSPFDPNQPNQFHNDQTQANHYPQYLQQQPGNFSPPPYVQIPKKKNLWAWYMQKKRSTKIGLGCLTIFVAFMLCGTCSGIVNGGLQNTVASTHTSSTIQPQTHVPQLAHTSVHTTTAVKPTQAPKPTATPVPPTPTPIPPTPVPTQAPVAVIQPTTAPAPPACSGVVDAGTCYSTDPAGGTVANSVPADFCSLVACVSDFATKQNGYIVQCNNGIYSHSGGVRGACSRDGGEGPPLYQH